MSTVRRVAKNTFFMIFGEIGAKALTVGYTILLAKYLLVEGFGTLSFFLALTGMLGLFTDIGFFELTVREVARNRSIAKKYLSNLFLLKSLIVITVFGLFFIYLSFAEFPWNVKLLAYLLALAAAIDSLASIFRSIMQGFEEMIYISVGKILRGIILFGGTIILIFSNYGLVGFGVLYLIANFISFSFLLFIIIKKLIFTKLSFEFDRSFWKTILKEGVSFWAATAFVVVLNDTDKIMLYTMVGEKAVGLYSAAYRMVFALNFIPLMFIVALYPVTSRLFTKSTSLLVRTSEIAFKFVLVVGLGIAITLSSFSDFVVLTIFGREFSGSAEPLRILIWSQLFLYLNVVLGNLLMSANMQVIRTYQVSSAAILNVSLNFILIPAWSYVGASLATLVARFFSFIFLSFVAMRKFNFSKTLLLQSMIVVVISAFSAYTYIISGNLFILAVSLLIVSIFLYFRIFDESDKKVLIKLIRME